MIFRQLYDKETSTYTYLLADEASRDALLLDSVDTKVDRDLQLLEELGLTLRYTLETHTHADHITGAGQLAQRTGAQILSPDPLVDRADITVKNGDRLKIGRLELIALATPGHTDACTCYYLESEGMVFTGDTLFIRGCGRTDFQGGDAATLYRGVYEKLFTLPEQVKVYPGHDYRGHLHSTIAEEKRFNPRLAGKTSAEFCAIMEALDLPKPKRLHEALPANRNAGYPNGQPPLPSGLEVDVPWLHTHRDQVRVIDVRGRDEFYGSHGYIEGAELVPLDRLKSDARSWKDRDRYIVVNCHSGKRSLMAVKMLRELGFKKSFSLAGGILAWRAVG